MDHEAKQTWLLGLHETEILLTQHLFYFEKFSHKFSTILLYQKPFLKKFKRHR